MRLARKRSGAFYSRRFGVAGTAYLQSATGVSQDTTAGKSFWRSPKLLALLAFIAFVFVAVFSLGGVDFGPANAHKETAAPAAAKAAPASDAPVQNIYDVANDVLPVAMGGRAAITPNAVLEHPFGNHQIYVAAVVEGTKDGEFTRKVMFQVEDDQGRVFKLADIGYKLGYRGPCYVVIKYKGWEGSAICRGAMPAQRFAQGQSAHPAATPNTSNQTNANALTAR